MIKRLIVSVLALCAAGVATLYAGDMLVLDTDYVVEKAAEGAKIDSIFVVKTLNAAMLKYEAAESEPASKFKWYKFDITGAEELIKEEESEVMETSVPLDVEAPSMGYLVKNDYDDILMSVWVFYYKFYKPVFLDFDVVENPADRCEFVHLSLERDVVPMQYTDPGDTPNMYTLDRLYLFRYDSTRFESQSYVTEEIEYYVKDAEEYILPAPLDSTYFRLMGDKYSMAFDDTVKISTGLYYPYAIETHVFTSVRIRENATNERDRGEPRESQETVTTLKGSAPLNFEALNYSSLGAYHYNWVLATDNSYKGIVAKMVDRDFRYTFNQQGTYYLRVEVSNASISEEPWLSCTQTKEFVINVIESALDVPTVFTPNGDGKNDIFKVSYKSIIKFHGSIYNTWGRLVYDWDDPAEGWDGTINGKPAAEGAYLYIIEATGDDKDEKGNQIKYVKKGTVSIVR